MKVQCIIGKFSENNDLCFNRKHIFSSLSKISNFYEGDFQPNTTHILFIDLVENVLGMKEYVLDMKKSNIKIIVSFFDEARFKITQDCIDLGLIDKLILFDKQYQFRFPNTPTYISDYFLNQDLFPIKYKESSSLCCYFGHNTYDRNLPNSIIKIVDLTKYENLYETVQEFNGVLVFDTGRSECGEKIIHHNKAKAIEALMCGVNAYCQSGINTINYNNYISKYESYKNPISIEFDQKEIFELNKKVIYNFISEIKNT